MLLDLDLFKNVNDTLGHSAGDELIVKVADALRERLRDGEVIARLGGDEFAVLLPDGGAGGRPSAIAAQLLDGDPRACASRAARAALRNVTRLDRRRAVRRRGRLTGEDVLVNADLAMYEAKEAGRDRVAVTRRRGRAAPRSTAACPGPT